MLGLFLVLFAVVNAEFKEEHGVFVLTDKDFSDALDQHENVMVMFYAPWCGHCKSFKPAYEEAAQRLKENPKVILAKVDATENEEVSKKYQITGYPTVKLFRNKEPVDFNAGRDADSVVSWVLKKIEPPVTTLTTVEEVKSFIDSGAVTLVVFSRSENPALASVFTKLADLDRASIGFSTSPDVLKEYGIGKDVAVALFRKFDDPRVDFEGELTSEALEEFLMTESIPLVVDFDAMRASEVFNSPIKRHVVFFAKKPESYDTWKEKLLPIAKTFKGKLHFILIDVSDAENTRVLEYFGLQETDVPVYRVIYFEEDVSKFKPETNDLTEEGIRKFIENALSGVSKPYLLSEEVPPETNDPVKILVGSNFNDFVRDKSKAVFAFLHAPWCGHCKQLSPVWDELGKLYLNREDIVIVKMDATANEAEGLKVQSFPTLKYYGKDTDEVVDYSGGRSLEELKNFVESGGKAVDDAKPPEDEEKVAPRDEL